MGKSKKVTESEENIDESNVSTKIKEEIKVEDTYDEKLKNVNPIAKPMAPKKLARKCYKLIKKGKNFDNIIIVLFFCNFFYVSI